MTCAQALLAENITGIAEREGFAYRRWARGMLAAAEKMLLDATTPAP